MRHSRRFETVLFAALLAAAVVAADQGAPMRLIVPFVGLPFLGALMVRLAARDSGLQPRSAPVDERLRSIDEQLTRYQDGLTRLARAHAQAQADATARLAALRGELAHLEVVNADQHQTLASLRRQHAAELRRLEQAIERQRDVLAELEQSMTDGSGGAS
jgi:chromosome segregation ATPase